MDPAVVLNFENTVKSLLASKSPQEYDDDILFEYVADPSKSDRHSGFINNVKYFADVKQTQPFIIVQKGRKEDANATKCNDISQNSSIHVSPLNKNRNKVRSSSTNSTGQENTRSTSDLEGSPLKLQAFVDLSTFDSPSYITSPTHTKEVCSVLRRERGIPSRKARQLLSLFSTFFTTNINMVKAATPPDLWILCNATDIKSTIILGGQSLKMGDKVGLRLITVTLTDKLMEVTKELHEKTSNTSEPRCYARYNVIESSRNNNATYQGSLVVDYEWKRVSSMLQKPPSFATAFVKASVTAGDTRSPVYSFFQELMILRSFTTALSNSQIKWVVEQSDVPLMVSVKELIEQLQQGHHMLEEAEDNESQDEDQLKRMENLVFKERKDFDFTDHLWKVFIGCSAYSDLVSCLQHVLSCLRKGKLQPMVHNNNHTLMAQLVRDSYMGRMVPPSLTGITPIQMLIEMGAEKLKRDYINAFLSTDLTTLSHLNLFVSSESSLDEQIKHLAKLHNVLEMAAMLKVFLSLPHSTLGSIARQMLRYYETNDVDDEYLFEFPVPTSSVLPVHETKSPCVWQMASEETFGSVTESTVYCLTVSQPFTHVPNTRDSEEITDETKHFQIKKIEAVTLF